MILDGKKITKLLHINYMYKILDLFSGIGGFSLGLERTGHFKTTAFCEIDKFCKLILDKHWKGTKIYDNVKEITKERLEADGIEFPDIITGGFPCQSFSVAGKQKGTSDSRYLWPEMFRIIKIFKPRYVIGENVRGIVNIENGMVFETVCSNLEDEGYEVQPFLIPAASVGAPHRRERIWFIAIREESMVNSDNIRFEQHNETEEETSRRRSSATSESTSDVVNTISNDERQEISRSDEETRKIQEEHRTEHSTTRQSSRTSSVRQSNDGHEDLENSRRTLQQGTELGKKNEDEIRKGNANQHQRSSGTSESNVADTRSERLERQLGSKLQGTREGFTDSSKDDANTNSTRSQGFWGEHELRDGKEEEQTSRNSWWLVEPNVGRVAHGVSGRVYRLKGLGNSIVPQIAEEIGRAIIEAEKE